MILSYCGTTMYPKFVYYSTVTSPVLPKFVPFKATVRLINSFPPEHVLIWGTIPAIIIVNMQQLERMQSRAVQIYANNYIYVSLIMCHSIFLTQLVAIHRKLIQFQATCLMYRQYHHSKYIPLSPPFKFGHCHSQYDTKVKYYLLIP